MSKERNEQRRQLKRTPETVSKAIGWHVMEDGERAEVAVHRQKKQSVIREERRDSYETGCFYHLPLDRLSMCPRF